MDTAEHEKYVFLRFASNSVDEALRILDEDSDSLPLWTRYAALRYSVICYLRPFTAGKTRFEFAQRDGSQQRKIALRRDIVPAEFRDLHAELVTYRHQAYAHTDMAERAPQLRYWPSSTFAEFPISFKPVESKPLHIHKDTIHALFHSVRTVIGDQMRQAEAEIRRVAEQSDEA